MCNDHDDCHGVPDGICEPNGFCSMPAERCESGRAYAEYSGALSGTCVEPSGTSGVLDETMGVSTVPSLPGSESGMPVSPDLGGGTSTGDPETSSSSSSSSTGPEIVDATPCGSGEEIVLTEFDELPGGGDWDEMVLGSADLVLQGSSGQITVGLPISQNRWWWMLNNFAAPSRGAIMLEVVNPPSAASLGQLWIGVGNVPTYYLYLKAGELRSNEELAPDVFDDLYAEPYDPVAHRWIQIRYDAPMATLELEVSADGVTWEHFDTLETPELDFEDVQLQVGGGVGGGKDFTGDVTKFDNVRICDNG